MRLVSLISDMMVTREGVYVVRGRVVCSERASTVVVEEEIEEQCSAVQ